MGLRPQALWTGADAGRTVFAMSARLRQLDVDGEFRVVGRPDAAALGEAFACEAIAEVEPEARMLAVLSVRVDPGSEDLLDRRVFVSTGWDRPGRPLDPADASYLGEASERAVQRLWWPVLEAVAEGEVPVLQARVASELVQLDDDPWERFTIVMGQRAPRRRRPRRVALVVRAVRGS